MSKFKKTLLVAVAAICLAGCLDKIKLTDPDQSDSSILVQGRLLVGSGTASLLVNIFELDIFENKTPRGIEADSLVLRDDTGRSLLINTYDNGFYRLNLATTNPSFPLEIGRQYRLEVKFFDGKKFQSAWETLREVPKIKELHFENFEKDGYDQIGNLTKFPFVRFSLSSNLGNNPPTRLRWECEATYKLTEGKLNDPNFIPRTCYCPRLLFESDVSILSTDLPVLKKIPLLETEVDYRFAEGFYLTVFQQSLSENAYGYFEELNQLLAKKGTLFDPPAGAIRTNISSPTHPDLLVNGFFSVSSQDTLRLYISPENAGSPDVRCPLPPSPSGEPRPYNSCDNCFLESKTATLTKPIWWKF